MLKWSQKITAKKGVIVGLSQDLAYFLPWWWRSYSGQNDYPVTFISYGVSKTVEDWCKERGAFINLGPDFSFMKKKSRVSSKLIKEWEVNFGTHIWPIRKFFFLKPLTLLHSSYEKSLWLDLDCEVRVNLKKLFATDIKDKIAIGRDLYSLNFKKIPKLREFLPKNVNWKNPPYVIYNSGVLLFEHGSTIIDTWVKTCLEKNDLFYGDQDVLSHLIAKNKIPIVELPVAYNCSYIIQHLIKPKIAHWHGTTGKKTVCRLINTSFCHY